MTLKNPVLELTVQRTSPRSTGTLIENVDELASLTLPPPPQRRHPLLGPTSTRSSYHGATA